jgi:hypothetical protein
MTGAAQTGGVGPASVPSPAEFDGHVQWDAKGPLITLAADRSLQSALRRIHCKNNEKARWVVVVRTLPGSAAVYYYALRGTELCELEALFPDRRRWTIEDALGLNEARSSRTSLRGRPTCPAQEQPEGPAAGRIVDFDAAGRIVAIGEPADFPGDYVLDRGANRGSARAEPTPDGDEIEVTLSAQGNAEIELGTTESVDFRIELTAQALPLAASLATWAGADLPIVVSLTVQNDIIEIVQDHEFTLEPPAPQQPRMGSFRVKGVRTGVSRLAVIFRQGGTALGSIGLAVEVVAAAVRSECTQGSATAAPRDVADDDKLTLIVEQRAEGGGIFYQYILHSEALGLPYRPLRSKPLLDRGGGPAASMQAFVERIYECVTQDLKSRDDMKQLQHEASALGRKLCDELLAPSVAKELWGLRDRIGLIQIVSWEPYIPWELVRLYDPESNAIDDRFLAEYGLVRTLSDETPALELPMTQWGYLGAAFPMGMLRSVGAELDYFTGTTADSLRGHGIEPRPIAATRAAFYDALSDLDFDVLHISCHAESSHQSIERASLIIGDETRPGDSKPRLVDVDTITVEAEARLKRHRPLVFLNACETGRVGAVLTQWGGWPNVFLRAGAGAFVGTAWAVRDKPAAVFATTFYNALLDDKTLAEAANAARAAAKQQGDASWLAFKVYGHPHARRVSPDHHGRHLRC